MEATLTPDFIHGALSRLASKDSERRLFGSSKHEYRLHPPVDANEISQFEEQNGIRLPDDYRFFITEIGNGGAGPAYGVFKFGEEDDGFDYCKWSNGYLVGDLSKPFVHSESWNHTKEFWDKEPEISDELSEDEEDRLMEEWDSLLTAEYWSPSVMDGAIPVCHLGCAQRQWLVINGPQRGYVWNDFRADQEGIKPNMSSGGTPATFSMWYLTWLQSALDEYAQ